MSNGSEQGAPMRPGHADGAARRISLDVLRRVYAIALIALIVWVSSGAIRYLISSLVSPTRAPAQIASVPKRLDESLLAGSRPDWAGLQATENPRTPLAHYHRISTVVQSDRFNDCTRGGCHAPLPHSRDPEVRAFLNMHASTIQCGVCHIQTDRAPLRVGWYSLKDGLLRPAPALLRAYDWLEAPARKLPDAKFTRSDQKEISELLASAVSEANNANDLRRLAERVSIARPDRPEFGQLLNEAREVLPTYFRGEYGAKLALLDLAEPRPILGYAGTSAAQTELLNAGPDVAPEHRKELIRAVHPHKREPTLHCMQCHSESESLIDFAGAGYPAARLTALRKSKIFEMIEHIARGEPFFLPSSGVPVP